MDEIKGQINRLMFHIFESECNIRNVSAECLQYGTENDDYSFASKLVRLLEKEDYDIRSLVGWFEWNAKIRWSKKKKRFVNASFVRSGFSKPFLTKEQQAAKYKNLWESLAGTNGDILKEKIRMAFRREADIERYSGKPTVMDMGFAGPSPKRGV